MDHFEAMDHFEGVASTHVDDTIARQLGGRVTIVDVFFDAIVFRRTDGAQRGRSRRCELAARSASP